VSADRRADEGVKRALRVDDSLELGLSDLLNRVLDKGVVISGSVTIAVAEIDLVRVELSVLIAAVESELRRSPKRTTDRFPSDADLPLLRPDGGK
jgi:hypothetical protein